jgi:hypothetical protein
LKVLLDILYGLLIFTNIALILLILLSPLILNTFNTPLTASVPVGIGSAEEQRFDVEIASAAAKGIRNGFVDEAQGTLRLETDHWRYIFFSYFGKLWIALGLTYSFYLLRAVLKDISQGNPFSTKNTVRIRRIGTMVLLLGFIRPAIEYFAAKEIMRGLYIEPPLSLPAPFNVEFILFGLLILLLAQIWSYGLELKRDQELTI